MSLMLKVWVIRSGCVDDAQCVGHQVRCVNDAQCVGHQVRVCQ